MIVMKYATANSANARQRLTFEDVGFMRPPLSVGERQLPSTVLAVRSRTQLPGFHQRSRLSRNPTLAQELADRPHSWGHEQRDGVDSSRPPPSRAVDAISRVLAPPLSV